MKKLIIVLLFVLFSNAAFADKMRVAVIDLKAKGISRTFAKNISELLRGQLINTGDFTVIERSQMKEILKEQGLQMTGCTDSGCAVKIGKLLTANKILVGTVMRIRRQTIVSIRIVDVEKGIGVFSASHSLNPKNDIIYDVELLTNQLTAKLVFTSAKTVGREMMNNSDSNDNSYNYAPNYAPMLSILPIWSGSFTLGFDGIGLFLVIGKAGFLSTGFGLLVQTDSNDETKYPKESLTLVIIGAVLWVSDIIYSGYVVSKHNKKIDKLYYSSTSNDVFYTVAPKIFYIDNKSKYEGMNFAVGYYF